MRTSRPLISTAIGAVFIIILIVATVSLFQGRTTGHASADALSQRMAQLIQQATQLASQYEQLKEQIAGLAAEISEAEEFENKLVTDTNALRANIQVLIDSLDQKQIKLQETEATLVVTQANLAEKIVEQSMQEESDATLAAEIAQIKAFMEKLNLDADTLRTNIQTITDSLGEKQAQLQEIEAVLAALQADIESKKIQQEALAQQEEVMQLQIKKVSAELQRLTAQLADLDEDGIPEMDANGKKIDNCPDISNTDQKDIEVDGVGDACDNCQTVFNADQSDADVDTVGDLCDNCPNDLNPSQNDKDGDLVGDTCDNCPNDHNSDQKDENRDGIGDICENVVSYQTIKDYVRHTQGEIIGVGAAFVLEPTGANSGIITVTPDDIEPWGPPLPPGPIDNSQSPKNPYATTEAIVTVYRAGYAPKEAIVFGKFELLPMQPGSFPSNVGIKFTFPSVSIAIEPTDEPALDSTEIDVGVLRYGYKSVRVSLRYKLTPTTETINIQSNPLSSRFDRFYESPFTTFETYDILYWLPIGKRVKTTTCVFQDSDDISVASTWRAKSTWQEIARGVDFNNRKYVDYSFEGTVAFTPNTNSYSNQCGHSTRTTTGIYTGVWHSTGDIISSSVMMGTYQLRTNPSVIRIYENGKKNYFDITVSETINTAFHWCYSDRQDRFDIINKGINFQVGYPMRVYLGEHIDEKPIGCTFIPPYDDTNKCPPGSERACTCNSLKTDSVDISRTDCVGLKILSNCKSLRLPEKIAEEQRLEENTKLKWSALVEKVSGIISDSYVAQCRVSSSLSKKVFGCGNCEGSTGLCSQHQSSLDTSSAEIFATGVRGCTAQVEEFCNPDKEKLISEIEILLQGKEHQNRVMSGYTEDFAAIKSQLSITELSQILILLNSLQQGFLVKEFAILATQNYKSGNQIISGIKADGTFGLFTTNIGGVTVVNDKYSGTNTELGGLLLAGKVDNCKLEVMPYEPIVQTGMASFESAYPLNDPNKFIKFHLHATGHIANIEVNSGPSGNQGDLDNAEEGNLVVTAIPTPSVNALLASAGRKLCRANSQLPVFNLGKSEMRVNIDWYGKNNHVVDLGIYSAGIRLFADTCAGWQTQFDVTPTTLEVNS